MPTWCGVRGAQGEGGMVRRGVVGNKGGGRNAERRKGMGVMCWGKKCGRRRRGCGKDSLKKR